MLKKYKTTREPNGYYRIHQVPIFAEISREIPMEDGNSIEMNYDREWVDTAVKEANRRQFEQGSLPSIFIDDHAEFEKQTESLQKGQEDDRFVAAFLENQTAATVIYDGKPTRVAFADIVVTDKKVFDRMRKAQYPGISVEIHHTPENDPPTFTSASLLNTEPAAVKFPPLIPDEPRELVHFSEMKIPEGMDASKGFTGTIICFSETWKFPKQKFAEDKTKGRKLQTIVVSKDKAPSRKEAERIANRYGKSGVVRETSSSYRFRQNAPKFFDKNEYKTDKRDDASLVYSKPHERRSERKDLARLDRPKSSFAENDMPEQTERVSQIKKNLPELYRQELRKNSKFNSLVRDWQTNRQVVMKNAEIRKNRFNRLLNQIEAAGLLSYRDYVTNLVKQKSPKVRAIDEMDPAVWSKEPAANVDENLLSEANKDYQALLDSSRILGQTESPAKTFNKIQNELEKKGLPSMSVKQLSQIVDKSPEGQAFAEGEEENIDKRIITLLQSYPNVSKDDLAWALYQASGAEDPKVVLSLLDFLGKGKGHDRVLAILALKGIARYGIAKNKILSFFGNTLLGSGNDDIKIPIFDALTNLGIEDSRLLSLAKRSLPNASPKIKKNLWVRIDDLQKDDDSFSENKRVKGSRMRGKPSLKKDATFKEMNSMAPEEQELDKEKQKYGNTFAEGEEVEETEMIDGMPKEEVEAEVEDLPDTFQSIFNKIMDWGEEKLQSLLSYIEEMSMDSEEATDASSAEDAMPVEMMEYGEGKDNLMPGQRRHKIDNSPVAFSQMPPEMKVVFSEMNRRLDAVEKENRALRGDQAKAKDQLRLESEIETKLATSPNRKAIKQDIMAVFSESGYNAAKKSLDMVSKHAMKYPRPLSENLSTPKVKASEDPILSKYADNPEYLEKAEEFAASWNASSLKNEKTQEAYVNDAMRATFSELRTGVRVKIDHATQGGK